MLIGWVWLQLCVWRCVCVWLRGVTSLTAELFEFAASEERKVVQVFHAGTSVSWYRWLFCHTIIPHVIFFLHTRHVILKASLCVCDYNALHRIIITCCSSCLMICIPTLWGGWPFESYHPGVCGRSFSLLKGFAGILLFSASLFCFFFFCIPNQWYW